MDKLNIYVSISDKYLHLIRPFMYLFNKYWGMGYTVNFLGYKYPNFDMF